MKIASKLPLLAATLALLACGTVSAAEVRIGVVNMAKLLQQSPQAQMANKEMAQKFDSKRQALMAEQNKIKALQDQINRNGAVMSSTQLQNLQNQLENLQQDFRSKQTNTIDDFNEQRNVELGKIQQAILKAVSQFAKTHQYNLIIGEGVFYADDTVDVTDGVLSQLQKDYKTQGANPVSGAH